MPLKEDFTRTKYMALKLLEVLIEDEPMEQILKDAQGYDRFLEIAVEKFGSVDEEQIFGIWVGFKAAVSLLDLQSLEG